jgi:hypothetical protein
MSLRAMRNGTRYSGNRTARTNNSRKPIPTVFLTPNGLERAQKRRPRTGPSEARTIDGCQRSAQNCPAQTANTSPSLRAAWILHVRHARSFAFRDASLSAGDSVEVIAIENGTGFESVQTGHIFMSPRRAASRRVRGHGQGTACEPGFLDTADREARVGRERRGFYAVWRGSLEGGSGSKLDMAPPSYRNFNHPTRLRA